MMRLRPWRECAYCGAATRQRTYCSSSCNTADWALRRVEAGGPRPHRGGCTSEWEQEAHRQRREDAVRLVLQRGAEPLVVLEESLRDVSERTVYRWLAEARRDGWAGEGGR